MEKLTFDNGMKSYRINGGGVLRFNPADPNVYARFLEGAKTLQAMEAELSAVASPVSALAEADRKMKQVLNGIFGPENDFEALLEGVNLLAVAGNGERVVTNLFAALEPILTDGARRCAADKTAEAVQRANARRAAQ